MKSSICLLVCYFGPRWPDYFPYFLASCAANEQLDFIIFTNLPAPAAAPNIQFVGLSGLTAFNELASRQLNFAVDITDPYKLCDFKPAYGVIFEEYVTGYSFWGYCDIDLIFGDIRSFITDDRLALHDVLSAVAEYPAGFFMLFRNTPAITRLFMLSRDYQHVFQSNRHFCFDECNFKFGELLGARLSIEQVAAEIQSLAHVVSAQAQQGTIRLFSQTLGEEFIHDPTPVRWQPGQVTNLATQRQFLLVHLINVKVNPAFLVEPFRAGSPCYVSSLGITRCPAATWQTSARAYLLRGYSRVKGARWRAWATYQRWKSAFRPASYPAFDGACYVIGNLKCTFYFQESNRYCIVSDFKGQLGLQQCHVFAAPGGRYVIQEKGKVSLLSGATTAAGIPFKMELHNMQTQAREVGYLVSTDASL